MNINKMENPEINISPNVPSPGAPPSIGKKKTVLIIILSFLSVVVLALFAVNIFSAWRCVNGEWLR